MIKIRFKSGEIVKVTDRLVSQFIDGKITPQESIAVLIAAKYDKFTSFILRGAQKNGQIPLLWKDITIEREFYNSILFEGFELA